MNNKIRALLVIFILLVAQLACSNPLAGQNGADAQIPQALYTFTSIPPFPTATATATATATPLPSPTSTITSSPTPTLTPTSTATQPPTLPPSATPTLDPRPISPVVARYLATPPVLDGDWSDWKNLSIEYPASTVVWGRSEWTGPDDLSASFRVGWDDKFLYLAIKVRDAHYVQNTSGANLYNSDSLELLLDTRLMADYDSTQLSDDDYAIDLSPGHPHPGVGQEAYLWAPNFLEGELKTVQIEARPESGVYRVEVAIPWTVFEMKPVAGEHYGFGISVSDNDNGDTSTQQTMISNLPERHAGNPTTWGDLQLVK